MNWIFDHFQIVILIALALGSWMKRRMDVQRAEQEERRARDEMADGEDVSEPVAEWLRPLLQAAPAPLVRQTPPPLVTASVPPPVAAESHDTAASLRRQRDLRERPRQTQTRATGGATKATTTGGAAATRTRVSAAQRHANAVRHSKTGLLGSLHSRKEIRRAIILREILGPPVGLR